jgi:putative transposase
MVLYVGMPSKNSRKIFITDSFYHVYNRGVEKRVIFIDDDDYAYFLYILKRHLSSEEIKDKSGRPYTKYSGDLELLSFCLMPNHFHILLYQLGDETAISRFMTAVCTAYTMYFNKKYKRVGHLFQERFKASHILSDSYIQHISRYIHLNPKEYRNYKWSSLPYFTAEFSADWVKPERILAMFEGRKDYQIFTEDYESQKAIQDEIKYELAGF